MVAESKKFKVKDDMTIYTITSVPDSNRDLTISWTDENGNNRSSKKSVQTAQIMFDRADWYYLDQATPVHLEEAEHTGGSVNYYKVHVANPTTLPEPYDAEANDIIESLGLTFAEGNLFKAIWRMAADRNGKKKKGNNSVYDAEKLVFFAERVLVQEKAKNESE